MFCRQLVVVSLLLVLVLSSSVSAEPGDPLPVDGKTVFRVWPAKAPGETGDLPPETIKNRSPKLGTSVIVLAHLKEGKVALVAGVSKDLVDRIQAPELIKAVGAQVAVHFPHKVGRLVGVGLTQLGHQITDIDPGGLGFGQSG